MKILRLLICLTAIALLAALIAEHHTWLSGSLNFATGDWKKWRTPLSLALFWLSHQCFASQMWHKLANPNTPTDIQTQHPTLGNFTNLKYIGYFAIRKDQFKQQIKWYWLKISTAGAIIWFILWQLPTTFTS